jgi:hypothetical protein
MTPASKITYKFREYVNTLMLQDVLAEPGGTTPSAAFTSPATVLVCENAAATDSVTWVTAASVAAAPFCAVWWRWASGTFPAPV